MEEIGTLIAGVNCTYEEAIKKASKGEKVIILYSPEETADKRGSIELVNFNEDEANAFFAMVDDMVDGDCDMLINCV